MARPVSAAITTYGPVRVQRRADGRLRVLWTEDGRQRERSFVADALDEAQAAARATANRLADDAPPDGDLGPDTPFGVLVGRVVMGNAAGRNPDWQAQVESMVRCHIWPRLIEIDGQAVRCREITDRRLEEFFDHLDDGRERPCSSALKGHIARILRQAVRIGAEEGVWGRRPPEVRVPGGEGVRTLDPSEVPTTAEVEALAAVLGGMDVGYGVMTLLAAYTGIRWGELIALRPRDLDLDPEVRVIRIRRQLREHLDGTFEAQPVKWRRGGADERTWPMREAVIPLHVLDRVGGWLAERSAVVGPDGLLFRAPRGGVLTRSSWHRRLRAAREHHGSGYGYSWHALRHHGAVWMIDQGATLLDVSRVLGHRSVATTETIYYHWTHAAGDRLRRAF